MSYTRDDIILWLNKSIDDSNETIMSDFIEEIFDTILTDINKKSLKLRHDEETLLMNLVIFLYQHSNTKINL